jgi:glycosyltransferase involved in cell wall biosynthesis
MTGPSAPFRGLRIAVVGPFPPREGALSEQTELLCRLLHDEGAWVQRVNTDVPGVRRLPRVGIHLLPIAQALALIWRLLVALPRCDVLHVQAASYWGFYLPVALTLLLGKLARRRVAISYSGGMARPFLAGQWRILLPLLRQANGLAVPTAYGQELVQRHGLRAVVLPNLLALETHPVLARASWPPLLLWLDELEPRANPQMALHALAQLRQSLPETRLLLVGSGSLAAEVTALARSLDVAGAVAYRPHLTLRQRQDAIREASVVWCTASEDNLPQLLLEAAASGTVVVATAVGGIAELLDDGVDGLLVLPEDATALAQATARVLNRPFLAESLAANARLAVERFAWRRQRAGWASFYGLAAATAPATGASAAQTDGEPGDDVLGRTEFLWSDPARPAEGVSGQATAAKAGRTRRVAPPESIEEL